MPEISTTEYVLLGFSVLFGCLFAVAGVYCIIEAVEEGYDIQASTRLNYLIAGHVSLGVSIFLIFGMPFLF